MEEKVIISQEEVRNVAELARLELTGDEERQFARELNAILENFKDISEVSVGDFLKVDHYRLAENQFREDAVREVSEEEKEGIRGLFPQRKENSLKVKETLGQSQ